MGKAFDWIYSRFGIKESHKGLLKRTIPGNVNYSYCLGGMAFIFYCTLLISGMLLSSYYIPSEKEAFQSVVRIMRVANLGLLIRAIHKWTANLLMLSILLHTLRVFANKAYRPPRELNWIAGAFTLVLSFASGFTGYLLPWDQKAYWATVVGTNMIATIPLIGNSLLLLVRGGPEVTGFTLVRFYSLHVIWFPLLMNLLLWAHFHMIRKQGISGGL